MTVRERVQAAHPAIFRFFVAAEHVGYRPDWGNTQNLTLYYDRMLRPRDRLLGGWNSGKEQEWYIAVRHLHGANAALAGTPFRAPPTGQIRARGVYAQGC